MDDSWHGLRRFTPSRIALGRAGASLPTAEVLAFSADHAAARDAVHSVLNLDELTRKIESLSVSTVKLQSAAPDRMTYVRRPDLGRRLSDQSRAALAKLNPPTATCDVALIVADGLSALAAQEQAPKLLQHLLPLLASSGISTDPICVVANGRVAIEDEIGAILSAAVAVILLGERPGLGTADSLGAYLVYEPRVGNSDAQRNCVSNIRPSGLRPEAAAQTLHYLLSESLKRKISGVGLKDERTTALKAGGTPLP
jgi:ethanolamine ammonia-lyase small subunit